jgi:hypothetical protein
MPEHLSSAYFMRSVLRFFFCTPFPLFPTINPLKENLLRITKCESDNWDEKQYFSSNEEEIRVEELVK